jgi:hypothetical protein
MYLLCTENNPHHVRARVSRNRQSRCIIDKIPPNIGHFFTVPSRSLFYISSVFETMRAPVIPYGNRGNSFFMCNIKELLYMTRLITLFFLITFSMNLFAMKDFVADVNNDGKDDKWVTAGSDGISIVITMDQNYDGEIDYKGGFSLSWKPIYEEFDDNNDGTMDTFYYYDNGALYKQEVDSNYDGKVDIWMYLYKSVYVTKYEADTDFDGVVDKVIDYTKNKTK